VRKEPIQSVDVRGLWSSSVHYVATRRWAVGVGYPEEPAEIVGRADNAVDTGATRPAPWPAGDLSYHFNRNRNGGRDSRLVHFEFHLAQAQRFCTATRDQQLGLDWPLPAAQQLGTALHPFQDIVAHGDFGMRMDAIYIHHNMFSPQREFGYPGNYPDMTWLDAVGSADGTPTGNAIHVINNAGHDYAIFTPGIQRYQLTRERTRTVLREFREYVRVNGGCNCRRFFGVE